MLSPMKKKRSIPKNMLKRKDDFIALNKFTDSPVFQNLFRKINKMPPKKSEKYMWKVLMTLAFSFSVYGLKKNVAKKVFNDAIKDGYKMKQLKDEINLWYKKT